MSIWCSTSLVRAMDYDCSGVYPWERRISESVSEVDFAYVPDYVYDHDAVGEAVMPYLRMSVKTPTGYETVVLNETGVRQMLKELTEWDDSAKRQPRRGKRKAQRMTQKPQKQTERRNEH